MLPHDCFTQAPTTWLLLRCTCDKLYLAGPKQKLERSYKGLKLTCGAGHVMHCVICISNLPVSGRVAAGAEPELTKSPWYEHLDIQINPRRMPMCMYLKDQTQQQSCICF